MENPQMRIDSKRNLIHTLPSNSSLDTPGLSKPSQQERHLSHHRSLYPRNNVNKKGSQKMGTGRSSHHRGYWEELLVSSRLNEEEKSLVQMRQIEKLPWKEVLTRYNNMWGRDLQQSALLMRMTRLTQRMDRAHNNRELGGNISPHFPYVEWSSEQSQIPDTAWLSQAQWAASRTPPPVWGQDLSWTDNYIHGQIVSHSAPGTLQLQTLAPPYHSDISQAEKWQELNNSTRQYKPDQVDYLPWGNMPGH